MKPYKPRNKKKDSTKAYYMYGRHVVLSALNNKKRQIHNIYCTKKIYNEYEKQLNNFTVQIVTNDILYKKLGKDVTHQGIIAYVNPIFSVSLDDLSLGNNQDRILILDQITDPQNIGSIFRSAAAFGINKAIITDNNTPDENAIIAKAASGCLELMQIIKVKNLKSTVDFLKKKQFWVAGLDIAGKDSIKNVTTTKKLALIIGSEGKGM
ncbi:MAG: RNA methyltransferase, partial [Rickettsiaceae bacterium]|nr:RNA methyltransferase [Rickettsiaceae bacterium]